MNKTSSLVFALLAAFPLGCCNPSDDSGRSRSRAETDASVSLAAPASSAPAAVSSPSHAPSHSSPRIDHDQLDARIDERIARWMSERTETDVFPGEPYRVDLFNDDGLGHTEGSYWVQRVWIDLDRDGKWDEKWQRKLVKGKVTTTRLVAPADDERYVETYVEDDDGTVSRVHARVDLDPPGFCIEDLGSRGGTLVNGQRIQGRHTLQDGDEIRIGRVSLRFER